MHFVLIFIPFFLSTFNTSFRSDQTPLAMLSPSSTAEVSTILRLCHDHGIVVVPVGGRTSLEGQLTHSFPRKIVSETSFASKQREAEESNTQAYRPSISLDLSNLSHLIVREEDLDCSVGAGVDYVSLNKRLANETNGHCHFPLDPGPGACLGGMAACSCSGSTALYYGTMKQNVISLTAGFLFSFSSFSFSLPLKCWQMEPSLKLATGLNF